jgi:chloramphenicol O-acetyltransferase
MNKIYLTSVFENFFELKQYILILFAIYLVIVLKKIVVYNVIPQILMKKIDLESWKRKEHFEFFSKMASPIFGIVTEVNCDECYINAKKNGISFFASYLHKSMIAVNAVNELKYRIIENEIVEFDKIHAGLTIGRDDETFGFGFVNFSQDLKPSMPNWKMKF